MQRGGAAQREACRPSRQEAHLPESRKRKKAMSLKGLGRMMSRWKSRGKEAAAQSPPGREEGPRKNLDIEVLRSQLIDGKSASFREESIQKTNSP